MEIEKQLIDIYAVVSNSEGEAEKQDLKRFQDFKLAAMTADALCLIIIFFTFLQENRACFLTSDGISDTLNVQAIFVDKKENFIDGSLWNNGRKYRLKSSLYCYSC